MKIVEKFKGVIAFYIVIAFTAGALMLRSNEITQLEDSGIDKRIVVNNN